MKANGQKKEERSSKLFARVALPILVAVILFGGACSSMNPVTGPSDIDETESVETLDESFAVDTDTTNFSVRMNNAASQVFQVTDLLFSMVDSLDEGSN